MCQLFFQSVCTSISHAKMNFHALTGDLTHNWVTNNCNIFCMCSFVIYKYTKFGISSTKGTKVNTETLGCHCYYTHHCLQKEPLIIMTILYHTTIVQHANIFRVSSLLIINAHKGAHHIHYFIPKLSRHS